MQMITQKLVGIFIVGIFMGQSAGTAWAQESKPEVKALIESRYIFESDVEVQTGDISVSETKASAGYEFKLDNGMPISFSLAGKHTDIDSDVAVFLPSQLVALSLGAGFKVPLPFTASENYYLGFDIMPSMFSDGWDSFSSDTFRIPMRTYGIYRRDENLIVIAGVSIRPDFDVKILPLIGFIYRPNSQWEINVASDNPHVTYHVSEKTKLFVEADLVNDEYELTSDGNEGRVLFYRSFSAGLGIRHHFTKNFSGLISAGSVLKRMVRYEDDNGKIVPEEGLYVKARFQLNF